MVAKARTPWWQMAARASTRRPLQLRSDVRFDEGIEGYHTQTVGSSCALTDHRLPSLPPLPSSPTVSPSHSTPSTSPSSSLSSSSVLEDPADEAAPDLFSSPATSLVHALLDLCSALSQPATPAEPNTTTTATAAAGHAAVGREGGARRRGRCAARGAARGGWGAQGGGLRCPPPPRVEAGPLRRGALQNSISSSSSKAALLLHRCSSLTQRIQPSPWPPP